MKHLVVLWLCTISNVLLAQTPNDRQFTPEVPRPLIEHPDALKDFQPPENPFKNEYDYHYERTTPSVGGDVGALQRKVDELQEELNNKNSRVATLTLNNSLAATNTLDELAKKEDIRKLSSDVAELESEINKVKEEMNSRFNVIIIMLGVIMVLLVGLKFIKKASPSIVAQTTSSSDGESIAI